MTEVQQHLKDALAALARDLAAIDAQERRISEWARAERLRLRKTRTRLLNHLKLFPADQPPLPGLEPVPDAPALMNIREDSEDAPVPDEPTSDDWAR
jgi:hypothetical protein